ncbi:MAG: hypothetical protein HUJ26_04545 [Planctomycetaceae bacterium]|nr:hypothetical protein [Planctomycetaceae bacterium]
MAKKKSTKKRNYDPPKESTGDTLHTLARAGVSSVPIVGGAANEFFQAVIVPPLRKRQAEWMEEIAGGIRDLEARQQCVMEELSENDAFLDTVLHASQTATRTANVDKRNALRNAVLNAALPNPPDESKQQLFIQFVDTLTVWHIRLLELLIDPLAWFERNNKQPVQINILGTLQKMILGAFPELQGEDDFIEQCVSDLQTRGLLTNFNYHTNMGGQGIYESRGTRLGQQFIDFVTAPMFDD